MKRKDPVEDPVEDPVVWLRQAADPGSARIDQGDFKASVKEAFFVFFFVGGGGGEEKSMREVLI